MFHPDAGSIIGGPIRFGIVKTLEAHYRIDVVIDAFERYLTERGRMSATLDIYGDGTLLTELRARVERLGISDRVSFRGHIAHSDVPSALQSLDVFLLASETESFGVAAVEAMACGLPVIASDAPGFVEVLDGGRYGLLYPRGDVTALARHMITVGADAEVRRHLAAAGVEGATRYDWKRNLADMFDVLEATAKER